MFHHRICAWFLLYSENSADAYKYLGGLVSQLQELNNHLFCLSFRFRLREATLSLLYLEPKIATHILRYHRQFAYSRALIFKTF